MTSTDARDAVALSGVPATAGDLLELVRTGQAQTRADLSRLTGLSRTDVLSRVTAAAMPSRASRAECRS